MLDMNTEVSNQSHQRSKYAVWEITLKCNLACSHCGSRAGDKRSNELSTSEALDLVQQMKDLGIEDISLIGGEAYLRPDWLMIASEITRLGMRASVTTGGYGISKGTAKRMREAGIRNVSVSIDGMERSHNKIRGKADSWEQCFRSIDHLREAGLFVGCNTQINRETVCELPLLYEKLVSHGVTAWQIQLTVPMGNAVEHNDLLLQPYELLNLYPLIATLSRRGRKDGIMVQPGNNIGYFGPYERLLRGPLAQNTDFAFWRGCTAGQNSLGIEADGKIKGCPSLPSEHYTGGNIRERTLRDIYENSKELRFNDIYQEEDRTAHLWGDCATCEYAKVCRGGCSWTSHVFFGKRGNNPYCHHRAIKKAVMGKSERFYLKKAASGNPFDHGIFEIEEGPLLPDNLAGGFTLSQVKFPQSWLDEKPDLLSSLMYERSLTLLQYLEAGIVKKEDSPWLDPVKRAALMEGRAA